MNSVNSWFDILIVLCGIYIIYTVVKMKRYGKINPSVLLGKSVTENMIKDKEGFINYMYPKAMALGVVTVICGVIDYLFSSYTIVGFVIMVTFLVILAIYCHFTNQAKKKFVD